MRKELLFQIDAHVNFHIFAFIGMTWIHCSWQREQHLILGKMIASSFGYTNFTLIALATAIICGTELEIPKREMDAEKCATFLPNIINKFAFLFAFISMWNVRRRYRHAHQTHIRNSINWFHPRGDFLFFSFFSPLILAFDKCTKSWYLYAATNKSFIVLITMQIIGCVCNTPWQDLNFKKQPFINDVSILVVEYCATMSNEIRIMWICLNVDYFLLWSDSQPRPLFSAQYHKSLAHTQPPHAHNHAQSLDTVWWERLVRATMCRQWLLKCRFSSFKDHFKWILCTHLNNGNGHRSARIHSTIHTCIPLEIQMHWIKFVIPEYSHVFEMLLTHYKFHWILSIYCRPSSCTFYFGLLVANLFGGDGSTRNAHKKCLRHVLSRVDRKG